MSGSNAFGPESLMGPLTDPATGQTYYYQPGAAPTGFPNVTGIVTGDLGSQTITPTGPTPFGFTTTNPPNSFPSNQGTAGWFWNSQTGQFQFDSGVPGTAPTNTAPNAQGQQVPGLGGVVNPTVQTISNAASSSITALEELAIRAMMVLVGIVLLGGGIYVAGQKAIAARTIPQLGRAPL